MKNKFWILIILIGLVSCGGLNDAKKVLRNEKISNTDEFLIQKKDPLVLPPDYEKIPEPGTIVKKKADEKDKIRGMQDVRISFLKKIREEWEEQKND